MNPKRHIRFLPPLMIGSFLLCIALSLWLTFNTNPSPILPSFQDIRTAHRPSDKRLLDHSGAVIHELRTDMQRRLLAWTPLAEISPALQTAVLAAEDRRFYQHDGVDYTALLAAAWQRMTDGPRRGASTISMQLASMIEPHQSSPGSKTFRQKWNQIQHAWALERSWSKTEILETYLNLVSFRGELQGAAAAASVLFRKSPHGLTEAEGTVLAVLLRSPNAGRNVVTQRAQALQKTFGREDTKNELTSAITQALDAPRGFGPRMALAPHVAHRLLRDTETATTVRSTLDGSLQQIVINILQRHILAIQERNVQDGAVLVVENTTGNVLAYVGSSGDLSSARYVDGVQARRQAGSTLKPFLYGLAFDQRLLTSASVLKDLPLNVPVVGGLYRPKNYDEIFTGLVTVRTALAASLNIPAVRTLELVGADVFVQQLRRLGFTGITQPGDYYGPSLALGSADISLWELVNAYRTLANDGIRNPLQIRAEGSVTTSDQRLYSAATAFLIAHILSDRERRSPTFGLHNTLATRFWSAVKTGTSKEMRDNWCVGFSRDYTVGVWVGNFSGRPMWNVSGITGAAPVWQEVMAWLHRTQPSPPPEPPSGVLSQNVSFPHQIEPERTEWFLSGTEPGEMPHGLAPGMTHILSPVHGTIVALDPDIPAARQRIVFEAEANHSDFRWVLDGKKLGLGIQPQLWTPISGKHRLSLIDTDGHPLDTIRFEVRGTIQQ
jgi:penicillin-binding protein 1C